MKKQSPTRQKKKGTSGTLSLIGLFCVFVVVFSNPLSASVQSTEDSATGSNAAAVQTTPKQDAKKPSSIGDEIVGKIPEGEVGVGIDEKDLGNGGLKLPLDLNFYDDDGKPVKLFDYFKGDRPVILLMNYSDCPKMCSVQLNNLIESMSGFREYSVGKEFDIVSISIDPKETPSRAKKTKNRYVQLYNREGSEKGWHFLVGPQKSIKTLADAVGFKYRYIERQKYYSHAPIMMMCSPGGNLVRYIKGIQVDPTQLEIALVEAGEGKVGSTFNQLWIGVCYKYDRVTGKYTTNVKLIMQFGGVAIVIFLVALIVPYWVTKRRIPEKQENKELIDLTKNPGNFSSPT